MMDWSCKFGDRNMCKPWVPGQNRDCWGRVRRAFSMRDDGKVWYSKIGDTFAGVRWHNWPWQAWWRYFVNKGPT